MSGDSRRKAPGEWQEVLARKGRQDSQQDEASKKVITKFFVSNLPPKCSSSDLKEVFRGFGVYEGSYIARKLDRMGKRFAFVSFRDIGNAKRMEGEMGDLWVGSYKLFVTLARFVDGHTVDNDKSVNKRKDKTVEYVSTAKTYSGGAINGVDKQGFRGHDNTEVGGGRSFLDTVLNKNKVDVIKVDDNIEGFYAWYGLSLVGKVIDVKTLITLKAMLGNRGWSYVAIKYISGLNVMLVFKGLDDCDRFLMDKEMWSMFFIELQKWEGKGKVVDERIAWLHVHGIPVQLAIDQVLDVVGSRYGEVVQPARKSVEDNNFSYARIGVLCKSRGRIVDRVDIRWREDTYKVWIDEDLGEWSPDCLKDFDAREIDREDEWKEDSVPGDDLETGEIRGDGRLDNEPNTVTGTPFEVNAESSDNGFAVSKEGTLGFRKKYRKKNGIKNRGEASGSQERPKKRSRDDNDPFGLDRLIGIMSTSTPQGTNEERESHGVFCTPDLNMGSELHLQKDQVVEQTVVEDLVHEAGIRIDRSPLEVEAEETIALAKALGVANLQDFMPELHNILRSEGYQDVGKTVEVAFDNEDPHEVWVPATVLKYCGDSIFLVEYQKPRNGDQVVLLQANVDYWHIRPPPPHLRDKKFGLHEKVDVYYDYGWWSGVITKELADNRYNVFFEHSKKERAFISSKVRPHMKWYDGKWYNKGLNISEGDADENATRSLINKQIEQTAPTVAKQSTVATSIMKRTKQTIPESNDNDSSPSKKMKNGTFMVDSNKKTNGTSAGQSEDLDSEFGKTENLSYGKKVRSTREKGIEQETPTMDFSKKKGKAANENESVNLDNGTKGDSGKTKTQESSEKDATKDTVLPVVTGLQCNENTVSREKIITKSSTEIVPSVAEGDAKQLDAPSEQLTVIDKEVHEENASTVPKRKRGRPPKLQAKSPETPRTDNRNKCVDPSAVSVVESAQMKEDGSPTSSGAKSLERDQEPLKQDKLHDESQEQDLKAKRSRKKYSFGRGKRGKRRTISINTEAPVQDSQDASKEKADENMGTRKTDASVGKLLDTVSDDQPLSRWIDGMHSPIPIQNPASERRPEAVTCGMNAENLPFVKRTPLWHSIESMEAFQKIPQNPHFRPLLGVKESAREGMAIGTMVTFSTVVGRTYCLRVDGPRSAIEDCLETLVELESNGFDVQVIRDRLTRLLLLKDKQQELADRSKGVVEKIEEQKIQEKTIDDELDEIDRQIRQLEEERRKVLQKKEKWTLENDAMKAAEEAIEQELREVAAKFDGLAAAPL